ncbi:MAG: hypothetical protein KAX40_11370, partial [Herpetosiphon sp.]|nr:hypothetical protein [Herpetosiphon sp.]
MRDLHMLWAGLVGFLVDNLLSMILVPIGFFMANIDDQLKLDLTKPVHVLVALVVPSLMTLIGGGVAGYIAPNDARPAGAIVGGIGILMLTISMDTSVPYMLQYSIAQCVATIGAMIVADIVAQRKLRRRV